MSTPERLLIHAPISLFALPVPALIGFAAHNNGTHRVLFLLVAWWCAAGAVMMAVDARSRRDRYTRILALAPPGGRGRFPRADLTRGLRQTICGLFLLRALRYRSGTASRNHRPEGVDA